VKGQLEAGAASARSDLVGLWAPVLLFSS
jgi:hypothetical protein